MPERNQRGKIMKKNRKLPDREKELAEKATTEDFSVGKELANGK